MRPAPPRGGGRDGYILVEALAAIALGALVLSALVSFTGVLRRAADRAAASVETMEISGRTLDTLTRELRLATRRRFAAAGADGDEQQQRPFVFTGTPDRVVFTLDPVQASGLKAPVVVAYQVDANGDLLRAEGALPATAQNIGAVRLGTVERVDPGAERLRFAYVDAAPGAEVITDDWTNPLKMPAAVRITRLNGATLLPIATLRVPLLIDAEAGCADPDKGFCSRVAASKPGAGQPPRSGGQRPDNPEP
ncbi:MAG: hypothetical protein ABW275_09290 [Hansschlegelia sp.]